MHLEQQIQYITRYKGEAQEAFHGFSKLGRSTLHPGYEYGHRAEPIQPPTAL